MRTVQLTSDPPDENGNRPYYDVGEGEYQRLIELGMVLNAPAAPVTVALFRQEVADALNDQTGPAYAAGRAQFTLRATTLPPANPAEGELWFTFA